MSEDNLSTSDSLLLASLPRGGKHGFVGVRGKQGNSKNMYQGCTPKKTHRTGNYKSAEKAAVAFAKLKRDLDLGRIKSETVQPIKKQRSMLQPQGAQ